MDSQAVKDYALSLGFTKVGIAEAISGEEAQRLQDWLDRGFHADMAWMANPKRQDIRQMLPGVKSVISLALNYYTPHLHQNDRAKISRYGWGRDYHKVLGKKLQKLADWLIAQTAAGRAITSIPPRSPKKPGQSGRASAGSANIAT